MPRAIKIIRLGETYSAFDQEINSLTLREPSARMFMDIGPLSAGYKKNGIESEMENPGVLEAYLFKMVTNVKIEALNLVLEDMTIADALAVRDAVHGFFIDAHATRWKSIQQELLSTSA